MIQPVRKSFCLTLTAAAAALLAGPATQRADASIVTYEYTGVVTGSQFNGQFTGMPITGTFVVDTAEPMTFNASISRFENPFNVLSATISFGPHSFHSKPYEDFDQNGSTTIGTNRNITQFFDHPSGYVDYSISTYSGQEIGNMRAGSMHLSIQDRLTGAHDLPEYPLDFSSFSFGQDMDLASLSLGLQIASTVSTVVSAWGSVTVIPAPGALTLFGLAAAPVAIRRRRN